MSGVRFTAPPAPGGLCWNCDRRLHAGGRSYVLVEMNDGTMRPVHKACSRELYEVGAAKPPPSDRPGGEEGT